jgi:predicted HTH domain antitoxin
MPITVELPEPVIRALGQQGEISRQLLESLAADLYREGRITRGQVRQTLGLTWHQTEEFLARKNCTRDYSSADLEEDWQNNQRLAQKG